MDGYEIEKLSGGHKNLSYKNQNNVAFANPAHLFHHSTEMRFSRFFSGVFITAIVVNPPEKKLAKRTSMHSDFIFMQ